MFLLGQLRELVVVIPVAVVGHKRLDLHKIGACLLCNDLGHVLCRPVYGKINNK